MITAFAILYDEKSGTISVQFNEHLRKDPQVVDACKQLLTNAAIGLSEEEADKALGINQDAKPSS